MTRRERAYLRRYARVYAKEYLGVDRLPAGVPAIARAYADSLTTFPYPTWLKPGSDSPFVGLAVALRRFKKPANLV